MFWAAAAPHVYEQEGGEHGGKEGASCRIFLPEMMRKLPEIRFFREHIVVGPTTINAFFS
jgi:hypothetical protein